MGREEEARKRLARLGMPRVPPGLMDFSQLGKDQVVKDNYHRELRVGDVVVAPQAAHATTYRVAEIKPYVSVAPGMPPNLLSVSLVAVITMVVPRGASLEGIMRVRALEEIQAAGEAEPPGEPSDPPAEPPPGDPPAEEPLPETPTTEDEPPPPHVPQRPGPKPVITDDVIDPRD